MRLAATPRPTRGSSPLARGLPPMARSRPALTADHPRSRGVYPVVGGEVDRRRGSSPLARGLPIHMARATPLGRIIPARAGFTRRTRSGRSRSWDHPRSRGVYRGGSLLGFLSPGSSPLARGLLVGGGASPVGGGIIPARAGFTSLSPPVCCACADHPRSRGVYPKGVPVSGAAQGSSPLARGLPCSAAAS